MLEDLYIKNYALIDDLRIEFSKGFNIITGESGSGKSLIAGSISMLKGNKADISLIRTGESSAEVSAVFNITENKEALSWLMEKDIKNEDNSVLIRRIIKTNGKGSIFIQSAPVTRTELIDFSSFLFDIHGQHEHHTIMDSNRQRYLLDSFSGILGDDLEFSRMFAELTADRKQLNEIDVSEQDRLREIDILKFTVNEITEANLLENEDEDLENEHRMLLQHEKLFKAVEEVYNNLSESGSGVLSRLRIAVNSAETSAEIDNKLQELSGRLSACYFEAEDIAETYRDYLLGDDYSPQKLAACEDRLAVIHRLKKKYGHSIITILEYRDNSGKKIEQLENYEINREELQNKIKKLESEVYKKAGLLSEARKKNARILEKMIEDVLKQLGMPQVVFNVVVESRKNDKGKPVCGQHGFDNIEFVISPNKGEPVKAIDKIASGGELSRIMLAVKSVLSENDPVESMLFDEIDSGIGGEVAVALGFHLQNLSKNKQIICITHIASIAVSADNHVKVEKMVKETRTVTKAQKVENNLRVVEIARMLSGEPNGDASMEHARVLLGKKL